MKRTPTEDEIWAMIGFIKISHARYKTLKCLNDENLMPTEISKKTRLTPAQVSVALHDMKKRKIVRCMNEDATKGRIYQCTDLGLKIIETLESTGFNPDK
ncbi:MarR family transcriptional regulator [uncultured Methanobrevibacter sp.]|uniref:MarR family transcriptional regulator n=1 Tax=uncultured Methanobrevibacter sp. TaxID=253161 RepID=UPI0025F72719|nr:MarR family transcriptional regulator [uncultured Methanobrevibacter sp.]